MSKINDNWLCTHNNLPLLQCKYLGEDQISSSYRKLFIFYKIIVNKVSYINYSLNWCSDDSRQGAINNWTTG